MDKENALISGKELLNVSMLQHRIHDLKLFVITYIVVLKVVKKLATHCYHATHK